MNIREIQLKYYQTRPRLTDQEWLKIFPEARSYCIDKLQKLNIEQELLSKKIKERLTEIYNYKVKDEITCWFWKHWLKLNEGDKLDIVEKEIRRLSFALYPPLVTERTITDEMIRSAKEVPFENIIDFNRSKKAICPFHSEKTPSLSLDRKRNCIHCFGCGIDMDTIAYIRAIYDIPFQDAVRHLIHY